jgi:hypothetical protein
MKNLEAGALRIVVDEAPNSLRLSFKGRSVERQPGLVLNPYFQELLAHANQTGAGIELHFEELEHFNSSTVTALIELIQAARRQNLSLVVVYDGTQKSQQTSFNALRVLERPGNVTFRLAEPL